MTRFTDQLFDDLMREHGPTLASTRVAPTPKRHLATRPVLLTAGAGGLAVAATVGTLVASGGTPAYAVTTHPDGTVTLAVYKQSGIAQVNAKLRALGDRVVVVPVGSGCPSITSLPAPAVPAKQISVEASGSSDGPVTVAAQGVPAEDILVVAFETITSGQFSMQETTTTANGQVHRSGGGSASGSGQNPVEHERPGPRDRWRPALCGNLWIVQTDIRAGAELRERSLAARQRRSWRRKGGRIWWRPCDRDTRRVQRIRPYYIRQRLSYQARRPAAAETITKDGLPPPSASAGRLPERASTCDRWRRPGTRDCPGACRRPDRQ